MNDPHAPDWDPRADSILTNQLDAYDTMRRRCPVAWSNYQNWTLFRHGDVLRVLGDHDTFSNTVSSHLSVPNGMDPPEHGRYRSLIETWFSHERLVAFEPDCRDIARQLVSEIPDGEAFDLVEHFSQLFALRIQCAFMGWPDSLHGPLQAWVTKNLRATLARDRSAMADIAREFDGYITEILDSRRQAGNEDATDVTTGLMNQTLDGRLLSHEEIVSIVRNWTVGELGTISASVSILASYLAERPDLQNELRQNPDRLPGAIDEILRMDAPLISNRRVTTREVQIGGRTLAPGEKITLLWASANRDEEIFGDPDDFQPEQNADNNLLYGAGIHVCPGAGLARMELRMVMEELLAGTDSIRMAEGQRSRRAVYPAGGFSFLPVIAEKVF
ncbi:cytochrome P450 [Marinobacter sp.]|uniref:cytochrome P450 n=1 Tax=Marinobacter sp. TaxID=50741 RepID=UPI00384EC0C8